MVALILVFCFGIINFAAHKAMLESGHPLLSSIPWFIQPLGGRLSLIVEFVLLLGTMVVVAAGSVGWAWLYAFYTALNGVSAWLIASGRV